MRRDQGMLDHVGPRDTAAVQEAVRDARLKRRAPTTSESEPASPQELTQARGELRTRKCWKARARWLLFGVRTEPAAAYTGLYEAADDPDRIGICCSGGGIRSAAFNLGALQKLQDADELQKASYLSAVSGGSYIASAFCMVAKTWKHGEREMDSDPGAFGPEHGPPFGPGTPEEHYLRNHLAYLAPDGSAKVYLGMRMVAGLLVNVLLIGLPVLIAGLAIGLALNGAYDDIGDGGL